MSHTVIGLFDNATEAQQAAQQLMENGFSRDTVDISSQSATQTEGVANSNSYDQQSNTRHEEDFGDKVSNFFGSLFGNDNDEAKAYSHVASRSQSIVTVHARTEDEADLAADILDDCGAIDVNERASQYGYAANTGTLNDTSVNATTNRDFDVTDKTVDNTTSLPIIEEELQVGKRVVNTGGVRLRSRIVERPVEESLRLREERVRVERSAVNRPATEADFATFQSGNIELIERAEVPVVSKEARVVEEVSLNKDVEERVETIRDTVRSTEVDVENIDRTTDTRNNSSIDRTDDENYSRERNS